MRSGLLAGRSASAAVFGLAMVSALALPNAALGGAYTVQQGDAIEVSVSGLPELRHRTNVQPDGAISVPLLGALKVEGLTPGELRLEVQNQLAGKVYRHYNNEGREVLTVVEPEEVSAEIVDFRPIYITGDVAHPGQQGFRPQMTVRQALALAGGPDDLRTRSSRYARDPATVKSEYDIARLDMARAMARIARLEAQLAGKSDMPPVDLTALGLPKARIAQMLREEADILATTLTDYQRERDFLKTSVAQASDRITVVEKQQTQEEEGSRADSVELQRMIELLSKGQEINPRVVDARRALLLSSTRALQVNVQLLELKRQKAEGERSLQRLEDERRIAWLDQMQEATAARTTAAVKVHALEGEFGAAAKSQTGDPFVDLAKIDIEVFRQQGVHSVRSTVDDDFELAPGDTIEVTVTATDQAAQASPSQ